MIKIAPSILSADFTKLGDEVREVLSAGADWIHYDVMDGVLVPNINLGVGELASLSRRIPAFYDVHLMIIDPIKYVDAFAKAGAGCITFHVESVSDIRATIAKIRAHGISVGLTMKPNTRAEAVFPYLADIDMVLVMTVEPGFGGQKFMADMMPKVQEIRRYIDAMNPGCELEVDGGVDPATCKICVASGANVLVAGSAVYKAVDIPARIRELRG